MHKLLLRNVPEWIFDLFSATAFGATVIGAAYINYSKKSLEFWHIVIAFGLLTALYLWLLISRRLGDVYSFKTRSEAEAQYFAAWYDAPGKHSIFCNDLDWLAEGPGLRIQGALIKTAERSGSEIRLAFRIGNSDVTTRLATAGVKLLDVPDGIVTDVRFSLFEADSNAWIIVRRKSKDPDRTLFVRSSDDYMIALANDLFHACEDKSANAGGAK